MRFLKYLTEASTDNIDIIYKECSQFISEWKAIGLQNGLYRGVSDKSIKISKVDANKYRLPRDTSLANSDFIDNIYKKHLGIKLRQNGIFCSHNIDVALLYGNAYYAIPTNNYKLFVNPYIQDLYTDIFSNMAIPALSKKGNILDPVQILTDTIGNNNISILSDYRSARIKSTALNALLPYMLTRSVKDKMQRVYPGYITSDNKIYEIFNIFKSSKKTDTPEIKKEIKKENTDVFLSAAEMYDSIWKFAYANLEDKVIDLIKKTKQMSLAETCKYKNNEVILICDNYYLVNKTLFAKL